MKQLWCANSILEVQWQKHVVEKQLVSNPFLDLKILLIFYPIIQYNQFPQLDGKYYKNLDYLGNNKFVFTKIIELLNETLVRFCGIVVEN